MKTTKTQILEAALQHSAFKPQDIQKTLISASNKAVLAFKHGNKTQEQMAWAAQKGTTAHTSPTLAIQPTKHIRLVEGGLASPISIEFKAGTFNVASLRYN
jgi:hypothetical protein